MEYHWTSWIIFERNKISLNLMCFKLPRNVDVWSLLRQGIHHWPYFIVRAVRTATAWYCYYYDIGQHSARELEVFRDLSQYLEWTKYRWGKYFLVQRFASYLSQDLSNLGVFWLPSWMELWKIHHQTPHKVEVIHDQLMGLGPEPSILHEIASNQDRSLNVIGSPLG